MLEEHSKNSLITRLRLVIYEFFECSSNIPSGLSCLQIIETCGLLFAIARVRAFIWLSYKVIYLRLFINQGVHTYVRYTIAWRIYRYNKAAAGWNIHRKQYGGPSGWVFPTKMSFKRIGDDPTALRVQKVCSLLYPIVLRGFAKGGDGIGHKNYREVTVNRPKWSLLEWYS